MGAKITHCDKTKRDEDTDLADEVDLNGFGIPSGEISKQNKSAYPSNPCL